MNPVVRAIGKVLRLVGVSSPEDTLPRPKDPADPPSWRDDPGAPRDASRVKEDDGAAGS
jgi:hypothetical protein